MASIKKHILIFGLIIILVVAAGCTKKEGESAGGKNKVNDLNVLYRSANIDYDLLISIAKDKGFFTKNNLKVKALTGVKDFNKSFFSGKADVSINSATSIATNYYNNKPTKILALTSKYIPLGVIVSRYPKDKFSSIKKVGIVLKGTKSPEPIFFDQIKENFDIKAKDVNVKAGDSSKVALLEKNEIDMVSITSTTVQKKLEQKGYYIYDRGPLVKDLFSPGAIQTTEKAIEEKPAELKAFVKAIYETIQYIKGNKSDVVAVIQKRYKKSEKEAIIIYDQIDDSRKDLGYVAEDVSLFEPAFDRVKKVYKLENPSRNIEDLFYNDFAEDAVANK